MSIVSPSNVSSSNSLPLKSKCALVFVMVLGVIIAMTERFVLRAFREKINNRSFNKSGTKRPECANKWLAWTLAVFVNATQIVNTYPFDRNRMGLKLANLQNEIYAFRKSLRCRLCHTQKPNSIKCSFEANSQGCTCFSLRLPRANSSASAYVCSNIFSNVRLFLCKLWEAHSRLYRSRISQVNSKFS